jgi:hypothetical protein
MDECDGLQITACLLRLNFSQVLWLIETTFVLDSAVHLCFHLHSYDFSAFPLWGLVLAKIDQSNILMVGMVLHINFYILMVGMVLHIT